jgi:hypothetical protein
MTYGPVARPTTAKEAASQQPLLSNGYANKHSRTATIENSNRVTVFSVRSMPRCYKQDSWSNVLAVRKSPAGKNLSTKVDDIIRIRHQATTVKTLQTGKTLCVL